MKILVTAAELMTFDAALELNGEDFMYNKLTEEVGELLKALNDLRYGRGNYEALALEMADVQIVMRQIGWHLGTEEYDNALEIKSKRFQKRTAESLDWKNIEAKY